MIFGNLASVLENEQTIYEAVQNNTNTTIKKPSKFSSLLKNISHYGMNYDKKIYQNMVYLK